MIPYVNPDDNPAVLFLERGHGKNYALVLGKKPSPRLLAGISSTKLDPFEVATRAPDQSEAFDVLATPKQR